MLGGLKLLSSTTSREGVTSGGWAVGAEEASIRCCRSWAGPEVGRGVRVQTTRKGVGEDWKEERACRKKSSSGLCDGRRARAFMLRSRERGTLELGTTGIVFALLHSKGSWPV
jgi:hypothetical protein